MENALTIDPAPQFDLSPYLYMQFMEPLGCADASVEAGWDFVKCQWKDHFVAATAELAPSLIRWGGIFLDYYRWKEGVGPRKKRRMMLNLQWHGTYSNQVGTHEFVEFCRAVGADPLIGVNFESDGRKHYHRDWYGGVRTAGPREAADWVDYCNNPANVRRIANGSRQPFNVKLWQIGNETSYSQVGFTYAAAARRTAAFAKAMHAVDPSIDLIGWGDGSPKGNPRNETPAQWLKAMMDSAGDHLKYLAFHPHWSSLLDGSPLKGAEYRNDPDLTWHHLMNAWQLVADKFGEMRQALTDTGLLGKVHLAMTEGHFYLYPHNQVDVLRSWAAGVANARVLNVQARHGDILKIATCADFCGNRWTVNAVMIPCPGGKSYLMPVARVMSVFRKHVGKQAVKVAACPDGLDVTASRTGDRVFLHVINTNRVKSVKAAFGVAGQNTGDRHHFHEYTKMVPVPIASAKAWQIADDPAREIDETCPEIFAPVEKNLPTDAQWEFPAASVTAVEAQIEGQ